MCDMHRHEKGADPMNTREIEQKAKRLKLLKNKQEGLQAEIDLLDTHRLEKMAG